MRDAKATNSPSPLSHVLYEKRKTLSATESKKLEKISYGRTLGLLVFLVTRIRSDISRAFSKQRNFQSVQEDKDSKMAKHVVRYLIVT